MNKFSTLGENYILYKTLGRGAFSKVKLGLHKPSNQYHAIKIIRHDKASFNFECEWNEIDILDKLHHPNIVNLIGYDTDIDYKKKNGFTYKVIAIVMELISGYQLYQYIAISGRFSEKVARTYFRNIIETLEYLQNNNICHRDLKPENILLDENFQLKIIDFGLSLDREKGQKKLYKFVGTKEYAAPEIVLGIPYHNPTSSDLFSVGVILFMMMSGSFPFVSASPTDPNFSLLCSNQFEEFWKKHEDNIIRHGDKLENKGENFFIQEFRSLSNSILTLDPRLRLNLVEIKSHPWYNGPTASNEELKIEFTERKAKLEIVLKQAKGKAEKTGQAKKA